MASASVKLSTSGTHKTQSGKFSAFAPAIFSDLFLKSDNSKNPGSVTFYGGDDYIEKAANCDIVFRSPGIHPKKLEILREKHVKITSTTEFFLKACLCPVIGVTGTKGKGTTSMLIFLMLKEAGFKVYLGGNIGESPLSFLDQIEEKGHVVVLEMSSFQLQDLTRSPGYAVVLGVTTDHLDYHQNRQEYLEAKSAIVLFQKPYGMAVFNVDYPDYAYYSGLTKAKKFFVSTRSTTQKGAFIDQEAIIYRDDTGDQNVAKIQDIALLGSHHLENVLPAVCIAKQFGVSNEVIQKVLRTFTGLPHRLELVAEINGVKYYDDSISTTPETSVAAVYAFSGNPVILIAGGSDKGADYAEWGLKLVQNKNLKAVVLLGVVAERMGKALQEALVATQSPKILQILRCKTFEEAVQTAISQAKPGDNVVLSPAAASFDMFENYKERGKRFKKLVGSLQA